jgi:acyl-CoA thioester hydrolase
MKAFQIHHFGPILLERNALERTQIVWCYIHAYDHFKMTADASRWTIIHELKYRRPVCATITVDGAWMDTQLRKLANPVPQMATDAMNNIPKVFVVI